MEKRKKTKLSFIALCIIGICLVACMSSLSAQIQEMSVTTKAERLFFEKNIFQQSAFVNKSVLTFERIMQYEEGLKNKETIINELVSLNKAVIAHLDIGEQINLEIIGKLPENDPLMLKYNLKSLIPRLRNISRAIAETNRHLEQTVSRADVLNLLLQYQKDIQLWLEIIRHHLNIHSQIQSVFFSLLDQTIGKTIDSLSTLIRVLILFAFLYTLLMGLFFVEQRREIIERKRTEEEIYRREQEFRALAENSPDIIARFDKKLRHVYVNPAVEAATGMSPKAFIGKDHQALGMPKGVYSVWQKNYREIFATGQKRVVDFTFPTPAGLTYFQAIMVPEYARDGSVAHVLSVARDVTEMKLAQQSLQKAQEELLLKERLAVLGHFAGSISHELRNPLAVIDGSAYFLKMKLGNSDENIDRSLELISANVKKSVAIIESLLNLSRMEKPKMEKNDLTDLITETLRSAKIPDTVEVVSDMPDKDIFVDVETEQVRMALKNIIKNATQAMSDAGKLTIKLRSSESGQAELSVADTGPGIPPERLEKVFEPLFSTKPHGIGFGLSITKMIVENHGGRVRAISDSEGATFILTLPVSKKGENK
ncbi:ATP-binding protein [Desulfobacterales bacterium HSG2]|nr:ATP-binding protein [Desulfobacterales bacterium HSG2]